MYKGKCCGWGHGCICRKIRKILLLVGGLNWGLVGVGMLIGSDLNVIHMLLGFWPVAEGIVYVLVGLAAILKLVGCRCSKCMADCAACCASDNLETKI
jgi:uncharacterized membrane protein YuzA (DUF378 family)